MHHVLQIHSQDNKSWGLLLLLLLLLLMMMMMIGGPYISSLRIAVLGGELGSGSSLLVPCKTSVRQDLDSDKERPIGVCERYGVICKNAQPQSCTHMACCGHKLVR